MAKKKKTEEAIVETVTEAVPDNAVVETIEVKSPIIESTSNLKLADLSPKTVPAMKPYDQRTVQVTTRSAETTHFNKTITRKDFK